MIQLLCLLSMSAFQSQVKHPGPKEVHIWVSRNVAPSSKIRLNINTRNVPVVHVTSFPVDGLKWFSQPHKETDRPHAVGSPNAQFNLTIAQKDQITNQYDNYFSRQVNLPSMRPGVYLLTLVGGGAQTWAVVNVTNLSIVAKRSPYRSLVWVTHYKSGATVQKAKIDYFDAAGKMTYSSVTANDGVSLVAMPPSFQRIVIRTDNDIAGMETDAQNPDGQLRCLFQTDRPIYRPGQTVSFKAILRLTSGQIYDRIPSLNVNVQQRDPRDNPLDQLPLRSNINGSVAGSFKIPQEGMLGAYSLVLTVGKQTAYQTFTVAAYRKPEYKVDVKSVQQRYFSGDEIHFSVDASYYFGAPVPQANVHWTIRRNISPYVWNSQEAGWFYGGDGNLYARDNFRSAPFVGEGNAFTDNHGHADIVVRSDPNVPDASYSIDVTVQDSSRRQVTGGGSVLVYASELRIGLACLKQAVAIGDLIPVEIRVVDIDGRPESAKVQVQVITQIWFEKEGIYRPKVLATKEVSVPANGRAIVNLPALAYGSMEIEATAKDRNGRKARSSTQVEVEGLEFKPKAEVEPPSLNLKLEKRAYHPGEKVRAFAMSNRPKVPVLLTFTGGDIWGYKVLSASKGYASWTFETNTTESPNAYVNVNQWCENGLMSGNAIVPLADTSKLLKVEIAADKPEYKPGDRASFTVKTLDRNGRGVPSEVALSVVDEAIYAISQDTTPEPYGFYWGQRPDHVASFESSPEELSGGAFQRANNVAPVRQRFEDTAFWNALVQTDSNGIGRASFEMPGNLTSWRATGRAVTADTHVGAGHINVTATRPVTLRLATPRIVSQGDRITLIGTVNNRSAEAMPFDVALQSSDVTVEGSTSQRLTVPAKSEGTVRWNLFVKDVPLKGTMTLGARVSAAESSNPDFGDALEVSVPVVPRGVSHLDLVGGTIAKHEATKLQLAGDTLSQGSLIKVSVVGGIQAGVRESAQSLLANGRYGTMWAVNALKAAVVLNAPAKSDDVKEAFALLSRTQLNDGWGWWESAPADAKITAEVGYALALAKKHGYTVFDSVYRSAINGCITRYSQTELWEDRARLAATLLFLGDPNGPRLSDEVQIRGIKISPFGKLRLAEALAKSHPNEAQPLVESVLGLVSNGPATAYVPIGFGIGWAASETETTAELLTVLNVMHENRELQAKLARRLALPDESGYRSSEDNATLVYALSLYGKEHPDAKSIGEASFSIDGKDFKLTHSTVDESASVEIREPVLHGGTNDVEMERTGEGEAFYTVQVQSYRPTLAESIKGVRVSRRFEVMNEAGVWTEVNGPIKPSEPVRCTVVVWGDDISDALKVSEPIPAGFEYVDSDYTAYALQEVRDGALVHYLLNIGTPTYFRYYLRAEADGHLIALPAVAEYLRRPATHGNSAATEIVVHP